jgi:hypothetical protein
MRGTGHVSLVWLSFRAAFSGPGNQVYRAVTFAPPPAGENGRFPDRRIFARGKQPQSRLRAAPLASSHEYRPRSHMRRAGIRFAPLGGNNNHAGGQGDSHGDLLRSYPPGRDRCQRPWAVDWAMRRGRPPFPRDGGPVHPVSSADRRARWTVDGSPALRGRGTERRFMTRIARTRRLGTRRRRLA